MTPDLLSPLPLLHTIWSALGGRPAALSQVRFYGFGALPSAFAVTDLAAASIAAAGAAASELICTNGGASPEVAVDRRLSSLWFGAAGRPQGWKSASAWDAIAGDYRGADGWIRLHTNAPHHRAIAVATLGCDDEREAVAAAVAKCAVDVLESRIVEAGGCAAVMRDRLAWAEHPQGAAVAREPLVAIERLAGARRLTGGPQSRPLRTVRVLDLTRVLAGPIATRFLAGLGAEVLRIDPLWWDEPSIAPEVTRGKRCARMDLRDAAQLAQVKALLRDADVMIHGYRPGALESLGLGVDERRRLRPDLIDVSLDAYGWSGPWAGRRGFDSLVQMSSGIAEAGMVRLGRDRPTPLPVQALDHAQGYLLAASALLGLARRAESGGGWRSQSSLARVATLLLEHPTDPFGPEIAPETPEDLALGVETTHWGPMRWLKPPVEIAGAPLAWELPSNALGSAEATWR